MKYVAALALVAGLAGTALPALARDTYVMDGASMFNSATASALNQKISDFNRQTGKEVVVVTVPSLNGRTMQDAAERAFAQNQVNGVEIFLAKAEKQDLVLGDRASRGFFPAGSLQSIHDAMRGYFRSGDFDGGITTGVNLVLAQYRSHAGSLKRSEAPVQTVPSVPSTTARAGGFNMGWIWLILIAIAAFLIIRALFRAMAGPRVYPPGYGGGPGAPGYGPGPGYGGMGGGMGGGGSFWSGLLGGLGGAFIGNELFGRGGFGGGLGGGEVGSAGMAPGDSSQSQDAQGWQSDAGQADMSNSGGGGWGDSGGGFDSGGGGFDAGGGGDGGGGGW